MVNLLFQNGDEQNPIFKDYGISLLPRRRCELMAALDVLYTKWHIEEHFNGQIECSFNNEIGKALEKALNLEIRKSDGSHLCSYVIKNNWSKIEKVGGFSLNAAANPESFTSCNELDNIVTIVVDDVKKSLT